MFRTENKLKAGRSAMAANNDDERIDNITQMMAQHLELTKEVSEGLASLGHTVASLSQTVASLSERVDSLDKTVRTTNAAVTKLQGDFANQSKRIDSLEETTQTTNAAVAKLQDDFANFRGAYAENAAAKRIPSITRKISGLNGKNLRSDKRLFREDLETISTDFGDLSNVSENELDSFLESDLVWKARDRQHYADDVCYLTAEVSYTCNLNDANRAARHAEILKGLTQKPAYPIIVGVHLDDEAQQQVHNGNVAWFELRDDGFAPDI